MFTCHRYLSAKIIEGYRKCVFSWHATKVFQEIPERNNYTWNVKIGAHVTKGDFFKAIELYRDMRLLGIQLDAYTFPYILKASSRLEDLYLGAEIHSLAVKYGYTSLVFVVNSLLVMYAKCHNLIGARQLFDEIGGNADDVSWNSIISGYSSAGQSFEALELFRQMQKMNLNVSTYTYIPALQACADSEFARAGMEIHAAVLKSTHDHYVYVANALLSMYSRCGLFGEAKKLFSRMSMKNIISWNSMLSGFIHNDLHDEALRFFRFMLQSAFELDQVSVVGTGIACGRTGKLQHGKELHASAIKIGLDTNIQVGNTLLDMYAKCSSLSYANHLFDRMPHRDSVSWTIAIASCSQNNLQQRALELFRQGQLAGLHIDEVMIGTVLLACSELGFFWCVRELHGYAWRRRLLDLVLQNSLVDVYGECSDSEYATRVFRCIETKDVVSWTSMVSSYVKNARTSEALQIFSTMQRAGIEPDSIAVASVLSAAASFSTLKKGREIHCFVIRKGMRLEGSVGRSLIDMYGHCGAVEDASRVFNGILEKDSFLFTALINANGMHGRGRLAIQLFEQMLLQKFSPDHVTFLAVLHACSHSGLIEEGKKFLYVMKKEFQLNPWPEHYVCLVDLLARSNRIQEAYEFVKREKIKGNASVWCSILSACRVHQNKKIEEIALKNLLVSDPNHPGEYVLISNAYASIGKWKDAQGIRLRMRGSGMKKNPGCSWIEIAREIHVFTARDRAHPESNLIYRRLADMTTFLEKGRQYKAQTALVLQNVDEAEKVKILQGHSERLAIAYGVIRVSEGVAIRVTKNLRICADCHNFCKLVSELFKREIVVRDANRFHHFQHGICSCGDFW